jgi:hypothetical protein
LLDEVGLGGGVVEAFESVGGELALESGVLRDRLGSLAEVVTEDALIELVPGLRGKDVQVARQSAVDLPRIGAPPGRPIRLESEAEPGQLVILA